MRRLLIAIVVALWITSSAQAHLVRHMKPRASTETRYTIAKRDYAHAMYVCVRGTGRPKRQHCRAVPWLRESMQRLAPAPPIAHWALWSCITNGAYPTAPHEGNGYNGLYTGWLGMTTPWMGHYPPGSDWVHSDQAAVYAIAEQEYREHNYSRAWLFGQWPNTSPPCVT